MKNTYIAIVILTFTIAACGGKKDSLAVKKEALEKMKNEISALQSKAKSLEAEIALLENKKDEGKLVEIEELKNSEFSSFLSVAGKADADQSTIATAQVPATVTAVLVRPGQQVGAGQVLATLDNTTLKQSRLQLEQQVAFAKTLHDKQKRLWEQGVGTEVQYLSAKNQKDAMEKNLATLDAQIAMYQITSPITGTVESVDIKVGQIAAPGMPFFKVVNLSNLKVVADVAESYSGKINQGDKVFIEFSDINKKVESRVSFASKVIDPLNRTFRIEILISSLTDVKPNMIAKLQIADFTNKSAITVPTNCIQSTEDGQYVVIAVEENGKTVAKRKTIKVGHNGLDRVEILEGLSAGDKIIVNGYQELNDGQLLSVNSNSNATK